MSCRQCSKVLHTLQKNIITVILLVIFTDIFLQNVTVLLTDLSHIFFTVKNCQITKQYFTEYFWLPSCQKKKSVFI